MQPTCDGDCVSDVIAYKTAQLYQPTSRILVICRPWDAIYITVFEMYIRGFIQIKAWFSILHKSPLLPVFLHQRLISNPVWTQNQHTSLRADAVTSPPISEARAYVCRSSTPAASATVRAPNLASSCRDTVSEDDRKSFGCGGSGGMGGSSVELPATWSPRWICICIPTLIWDPPFPTYFHLSTGANCDSY